MRRSLVVRMGTVGRRTGVLRLLRLGSGSFHFAMGIIRFATLTKPIFSGEREMGNVCVCPPPPAGAPHVQWRSTTDSPM